jgi:serine/threonine protein kinase
MAPEIVEGKVLRRKERRGYSETVDWFALGVTVYVMLTGCQPFSDDETTSHVDPKVLAQNFPRDGKGVMRRPSGFAGLLQTVKFPADLPVAPCLFCKHLLAVKPEERLGAHGYEELKGHCWFVNPDEETPMKERVFEPSEHCHPISELKRLEEDVLLEGGYAIPEWVYKTARSKALQRVYEPGAVPKYNHFEHVMATFDIRDQRRFVDWYKIPEAKDQEIFHSWDFMSYAALKEELEVEIDTKVLKKRVPKKSMGARAFRTNKEASGGKSQF